LKFDAIFFDRMRLLSAGNPDGELSISEEEHIQTWCGARLAEFPSVQAL
jgi:hypothetical protein